MKNLLPSIRNSRSMMALWPGMYHKLPWVTRWNVCKTTRKQTSGFINDASGAISVDFVVLTAALLLIAAAVVTQVTNGAAEATKDVKKCMKIQGKLLSKDISYKKRLERTKKRCGKL